MERTSRSGLNDRANGGSTGTDTQVTAYQFSDDYVITSSASAGAWIAAGWPIDLTEAQ